MVADAQSSNSMAGSSSSAAEKHVDRLVFSYLSSSIHFHLLSYMSYLALLVHLFMNCDQLNDLFVELSSMLDHDRQNSGKATVLGDAARVLRDLITQVESLRKEQSTLLTEHQYVSSEKTKLQDENTTLRAQIIELQNELRARIGNNSVNLCSLGVPHPIGRSYTTNLATHPTLHRGLRSTSSSRGHQHHHVPGIEATQLLLQALRIPYLDSFTSAFHQHPKKKAAAAEAHRETEKNEIQVSQLTGYNKSVLGDNSSPVNTNKLLTLLVQTY
ncbi:uncharacterized protein LOC125554749 [Triticum urartu]|uniref:uncharacterized protein LOC125554749 n=1 Tax=Triticum urartu TaxID=4572 RepID=UPI002043136B|nr:uncharacterized protein LOC125554749 [Triticum urartu]